MTVCALAALVALAELFAGSAAYAQAPVAAPASDAASTDAASTDAPATGQPAAAPLPDDGKPRFVDVRVGFDKHYKLGCWTPVRVVVWSGLKPGTAAVPASLTIETADGDGVPCVYESEPFQLRAGGVSSVVMYVRFGTGMPTMKLTLVAAGEKTLSEKIDCREGVREGFDTPLQTGERLVICVGRSSAISEVAGRNGVANLSVAQLEAAELPTRPYGYDGVDAVLLAADQLQRYAMLTPDGPHIAALREWLESGGRLTIVAGNDARLLFADAAWRKLAPIEVGEAVPLPRTVELEKYAGGNKPVPAGDPTDRVRVPRSTAGDDVVELAEGDLRLIVRRAVGFGVLTVSFVDFEHPQLKNWAGRASVLAKAMRLGPLQTEGVSNASSYYNYRYGYGNLAGQLRGALDQYSGVAVISFFVLALMILFYIALIGPFDYLLVRKIFRRTEMTWFTFPLIVVATSAGAYYAARWMKGDELRVSQVDIIDCDVVGGGVRGTMFAGVFSPKSDAYDLNVAPPQTLLAAQLRPGRSTTTWLGLTGNAYGGMPNQGGNAASWLSSSYEVSPDLEVLSQVPIQVWSSKLFLSRWQGRAEFEKSDLRKGNDGALAGTLRSPLKVPLQEALLCSGNKAYRIPRLEPGTTYRMSELDYRDLSSELQKAEVVKAMKANANASMRTQPHDPSSQNVDEIVRKMMFYDAAGGRQHASLENDYQAYLDLSQLLQLNRAVLVGYIETPAEDGADLKLTVDGSPVVRAGDRRWLFVRVVLPVEPRNTSSK